MSIDAINHLAGGRESWTASPVTAVEHFQRLERDSRRRLLETFRLMAQGADGGQIEPWGPSVRSVVYPGWSDADFQTVVDLFSPRA